MPLCAAGACSRASQQQRGRPTDALTDQPAALPKLVSAPATCKNQLANLRVSSHHDARMRTCMLLAQAHMPGSHARYLSLSLSLSSHTRQVSRTRHPHARADTQHRHTRCTRRGHRRCDAAQQPSQPLTALTIAVGAHAHSMLARMPGQNWPHAAAGAARWGATWRREARSQLQALRAANTACACTKTGAALLLTYTTDSRPWQRKASHNPRAAHV